MHGAICVALLMLKYMLVTSPLAVYHVYQVVSLSASYIYFSRLCTDNLQHLSCLKLVINAWRYLCDTSYTKIHTTSAQLCILGVFMLITR